MRAALLAVLSFAVVALAGCRSSSPRGGSVDGDGFTVTVPRNDVVVRAGQDRSVTVAVHRDRGFEEAVALGIRASEGIAVEPANILHRRGDRAGVPVRVSAPAATVAGEYRVYVTATPQSGAATSAEFLVRVP
jgi:hypothetical protein